jgi:hypothetical protein
LFEGFKKRHRFSMRRTSQRQMAPEDAQLIAAEFGRIVQETAEKIGARKIWNADETAVFFDMLPTRTIEESGAKKVWVKCSNAQKRRISVLLLAASDGEKRPPFIVFKETPSKIPEKHLENMNQRHEFG